MLEIDCHMTKDRQAVVHHDFALDRTTGQDGYIKDLDYDVSLYQHQTMDHFDRYSSRNYPRSVTKCHSTIIQVGSISAWRREMHFLLDVMIRPTDNSPATRDLLRIPLLKDVFERYPTTPINIDIKENSDELIKQVRYWKHSTSLVFCSRSWRKEVRSTRRVLWDRLRK